MKKFILFTILFTIVACGSGGGGGGSNSYAEAAPNAVYREFESGLYSFGYSTMTNSGKCVHMGMRLKEFKIIPETNIVRIVVRDYENEPIDETRAPSKTEEYTIISTHSDDTVIIDGDITTTLQELSLNSGVIREVIYAHLPRYNESCTSGMLTGLDQTVTFSDEDKFYKEKRFDEEDEDEVFFFNRPAFLKIINAYNN